MKQNALYTLKHIMNKEKYLTWIYWERLEDIQENKSKHLEEEQQQERYYDDSKAGDHLLDTRLLNYDSQRTSENLAGVKGT